LNKTGGFVCFVCFDPIGYSVINTTTTTTTTTTTEKHYTQWDRNFS